MPRPRRFLAPAAALAFAVLPGCCLTHVVWSDDGDDEVRVLADESTARHVVAASLGADASLRLVSTPAAGITPVTWRLSGDQGADVARSLLSPGGLLLVDELVVDAVVEFERGEAVSSFAELRIIGRLDASRLGRTAAPDELPAATRERLQDASAPRFAFSDTSAAAAPGVFERCGERLRGLDLSPLARRPAANVASTPSAPPVWVASVLVGSDLQPFDAGATASGNGPTNAGMSFDDELRALQRARFVVRATDGSTDSLFVVNADRVPAWSSLAPTGDGRWEHRSRWAFRTDPAPAELAPRWRGVLHVSDRHYEWTSNGLTFWERVAWTPPALLGDLCGAWILTKLGITDWCCDDDEEEDEDERHP